MSKFMVLASFFVFALLVQNIVVAIPVQEAKDPELLVKNPVEADLKNDAEDAVDLKPAETFGFGYYPGIFGYNPSLFAPAYGYRTYGYNYNRRWGYNSGYGYGNQPFFPVWG